MALHMLKLCVGVSELKEFEEWRREELEAGRKMDHTTRMFPKRGEEILRGGSLYWVIRGLISVRQRVLALEPVTGRDGVQRCRIVFDAAYVLVRPTPRRAFQGWRYLEPADAPADLSKRSGIAGLPDKMRAELAALGLL
jgi:hypothetical protein